jgi:hypothetical protein
VFVNIIKAIFKGIFKFAALFGLVPMLLYALFGLILYWGWGFTPFVKSQNANLFWIGFGLTAACAAIVTVKRFIIKPAKHIIQGYKNPVWQRNEDTDEEDGDEGYEYEEESRPPKKKKQKNTYVKKDEKPAREKKKKRRANIEEEDDGDAPEKPKIYKSAREKDTVIHEYHDRFEVFKLNANGQLVKDKVEYKTYD